MRYEVTGEFTKISETTGTIQNMSNVYAVEVSNKAEADSGIILYPLNRISVTLSECYLRCVDGGNAEVRVVPFEVDVTRGGGSSAAGTSNLTDVFRSLEVIDGKVNFYGTTDKSGDILASFNLPEEIFLNQIGTIIVHDFMFSALAYPNSTNPNLDGKTVLVLAVKGDKKTNPTIKYVFVDLQKLVDKYLASNKSININGYSIAVNISDDTKNLLALKEDGLFVGSDDSKLDKVPSAVQDNIPVFDEEGTIIDGGLSFADLEYELPTASVTTKGGVKVGSGLAITGDTLNVTISGGASYADFTGATSISGGLSGLVPAPPFGAENYFLRGDGNWASVAGGDNSEAYVLSDHISTVEGGVWAEEINGLQTLRLRSGNYIYNFNYASSLYDPDPEIGVTSTVQPNVYVLDTVPSSDEGAFWYSSETDQPKIWFRKGNYRYGIHCDTLVWVGGNTDMVSYLPFNVSPTIDVFGNTWTAVGNPAIVDYANSISGKALYLNGSSYLQFNDIETLLGASPFTIDFWAAPANNTGTFWHFFNKLVATSGMVDNGWVKLDLYQGQLRYISADTANSAMISYPCALNTHHHFALTYDGAVNRVFVDGQLLMTKNRVTSAGGVFRIGARADDADQETFTGYIDHFRIFKGVALWTENFTPPTAAAYQ